MSDAHATMLAMPHDWFSDLTGFREEGYDLTRQRAHPQPHPPQGPEVMSI